MTTKSAGTFFSMALALFAFLCGAPPASAEPPPVEAFGPVEDASLFAIAPDGTAVAASIHKTGENLESVSPVSLVGRVRAPTLLIHGDRDVIVPVSQSKDMADALESAGKPHESVDLEGEDHFLAHADTRIRTLAEVESFLVKHLGERR